MKTGWSGVSLKHMWSFWFRINSVQIHYLFLYRLTRSKSIMLMLDACGLKSQLHSLHKLQCRPWNTWNSEVMVGLKILKFSDSLRLFAGSFWSSFFGKWMEVSANCIFLCIMIFNKTTKVARPCWLILHCKEIDQPWSISLALVAEWPSLQLLVEQCDWSCPNKLQAIRMIASMEKGTCRLLLKNCCTWKVLRKFQIFKHDTLY